MSQCDLVFWPQCDGHNLECTPGKPSSSNNAVTAVNYLPNRRLVTPPQESDKEEEKENKAKLEDLTRGGEGIQRSTIL